MKNILIKILLLLPIILPAQDLTVKKKKGKYGFYLNKKKVNENSYDDIDKLSTKDYLVKIDEKWGVVDSLGIEVIECKYDSIEYNFQGDYTVVKDKKWGIINKEDEEILEIKYQKIDHYIEDSIALLKLNDEWWIWEKDSLLIDPERTIFRSPEIMPKFADCKEEKSSKKSSISTCDELMLFKYLFENIRYPEEAKEKSFSGIVVIQFIIDGNGEIINPEIRRDIGGGCGEEALRVIKTMDNWIPGKQDGKIVKTLYNLPVRFKLDL